MRHPFLATLLLAAAPLLAQAQSTYTDPNGRFTLQVPAGWRVEAQGGGVSLLKDQAYASVLTAPGRGAPKSMVEALAQRFGSQWQNFSGTSSGEVQFGGKPGAYGWYTGMNPRGTAGVLRIVATVEGDTGFAMMLSAPRSAFANYKGELEQIEAGFHLAPGARR